MEFTESVTGVVGKAMGDDIPPEFYIEAYNAYYWPRFDLALSKEHINIAEQMVANDTNDIESLIAFWKQYRSFKGDTADIKKEKISIKLSGYQNPIVNINGVEVAVNPEAKTEVEAIILPSIFSYHIRGDAKTASTIKKVASTIIFRNNTFKDSLLLNATSKTPVLAKAIKLPFQIPKTKVPKALKKGIADE